MARLSDGLVGVVTRPSGSDSYWPPIGTNVPWRAIATVCDMYDHAAEFHFTCLGVKGNRLHLQKHGDHTPYSAGKKHGWIYAIDLDMPDSFGPWFRKKCQSNYDTMWVDFWNFRNRQYDNAGNDVGYSDDHHLHLSGQVNYEAARTNLIKDYAVEMGFDVSLLPDERAALLAIQSLATNINSVLMDGKRSLSPSTHDNGINFSWLAQTLNTVANEQKANALADKARDEALKAAFDLATAGGTGTMDSAAIINGVNAKVETVRQEFLTKLQQDQEREAKAADAAAAELRR